MKSKKIIILLIASLTIVSLIGCNKIPQEQDNNSETNITDESPSIENQETLEGDKYNVVTKKSEIDQRIRVKGSDQYPMETLTLNSQKCIDAYNSIVDKYIDFGKSNGYNVKNQDSTSSKPKETELRATINKPSSYYYDDLKKGDIELDSQLTLASMEVVALASQSPPEGVQYRDFFNQSDFLFYRVYTHMKIFFNGDKKIDDMRSFKIKGSDIDNFRSTFTDKPMDYKKAEKYINDYLDEKFYGVGEQTVFLNDLGEYYETISVFDNSITYELHFNPYYNEKTTYELNN